MVDKRPVEPRPSTVASGAKPTLDPSRMAVIEWAIVAMIACVATAIAGAALACLVVAIRWAF